ncbi:hypothetical protein [Actinocorallia sp. API 0066]|nr:hypothetical protein [Actinocorallia sp. API 0066]
MSLEKSRTIRLPSASDPLTCQDVEPSIARSPRTSSFMRVCTVSSRAL